jgi:HEAT repeat protein
LAGVERLMELDEIVANFKSCDPKVREDAARAAGEPRFLSVTGQLLTYLEPLLEDPNEHVRNAASVTLCKTLSRVCRMLSEIKRQSERDEEEQAPRRRRLGR